MQIVVHGGAGSAPEEPDAREAVLERAATMGAATDTPLEAVLSAVRPLESSPRFNAGRGGARQSDGTVRTDAGLMLGDGLTGAACGMAGVEQAVDVARVVMTETPHVLVAGEGAMRLAASADIETEADLLTERTRERWGSYERPTDLAAEIDDVRARYGEGDGVLGMDTVGAVASDGDALAAATSTGGRWFAFTGRVGDVPMVGAGFYASAEAAASTTGEGEAIARFGLARDVVDRIEDGAPPDAACRDAIEAFEASTGGTAGVIATDVAGDTGEADNAELMQTAAG